MAQVPGKKKRSKGKISILLTIVLGMMVLQWIYGASPPEIKRGDQATTAGGSDKSSAAVATKFIPEEADCGSVDKASLGKPFILTTKTNPSFQIMTHDPDYEIMSTMIRKHGCFECEMLELAKEQLLKHDGAYLLDIGGNLGLFSLLAASVGRHAYTFEPFPNNWQRLCQSMALNKLESNIHLYNVALGDTEDDLFFHGPKNNFGAVGTVPINNANNLIYRNATDEDVANRFKARRLNQFAPVLPSPSTPMVLKVDVEGSECAALLGGMDWLEQANIVWAVVETSPYNMKRRCFPQHEKLVTMFANKGLKPYFYNNRTDLIGPLDTSTWTAEMKRGIWLRAYNPSKGNLDLIWTK